MAKRIVLISGGSDGLGKAIAERLAPAHTVVIFAPDAKKTEAAAGEIGCEYEIGDVSRNEDIERIVGAVMKRHSRIDCLVNNAGIFAEKEFAEHEPELIRRILDINTCGTLLLTRAVLPHMKKQRSGLIINVVSQAGICARPGYAVYTTSKWAITGFTKSLQRECAPRGIRVAGLYPGLMKTNIFRAARIPMDEDDWKTAINPHEAARAVEFMLSLPDEVLIPELGIKHVRD